MTSGIFYGFDTNIPLAIGHWQNFKNCLLAIGKILKIACFIKY